MVCHSCGGVVGRDCFNPQECEQITRQMAEDQRQQQWGGEMASKNDKLRTVVVRGEIRSVAGLQNIVDQFVEVAHECDSSAHEISAIAMRWAIERIRFLESKLDDVSKALEKRN